MAKTVGILGSSGDGKSTAIIVPPTGGLPDKPIEKDGKKVSVLEQLKALKGQGMNAESTVIVNCDGKELPFPYEHFGWKEGKNLFTSTFDKPITSEFLLGNPTKNRPGLLDNINKGTGIKAVVIDTMNGAMNDREMLETRNLSWDKWYDLAKDFYALCVKANSLRSDLVIYLMAHVVLQTDVDGNEMKAMLTNGKKLEKIKLESKLPVVLVTNVSGMGGDNEYVFETQKNRSSAKSPIGMFDEFTVPNSLRLVDDTIRQYYGI